MLTSGFNIPLEFQPLVHGLYDAKLNNINFDRDRLEFRFPNGVVEKVKLDKHLQIHPR